MPDPEAKERLGNFQLEEILGVGGMGMVYRATYLKNGAQVALKVLAPDLANDEKLLARFDREMEILKKLKHPHIIKYYGGSVSGLRRYYAMEMLGGGSVADLLKKQDKLSWQTTIEYGLQIAKALEHAHQEGVIHRDLKPGNLLLTSKGVLKLSDFGIARDTRQTALTATGKTVGTMAYMAPEQIHGKHPITRRTDLYALGCVLFQLMTGRTPFQSENQPELLFKHIDEAPPNIRDTEPDCPIWLDQLVDELLHKHPDDRPYDALQVQVQLEDVRTKVTEQTRIQAQKTAVGTSQTVGADRQNPTLSKARKKRKRKKKARHVPVYERTWFLGCVLAGLMLLAAWALWPASEAKLFADAERLMASDEPYDWDEARRKYIEPMLERFPDGPHTPQAQRWIDDIDMYKAERQAERNAQKGREPQSEAERLYVEALQYQRFGDALTAREKYEAMGNLLRDTDGNIDPVSLPFVNLSRKRVQEMRATSAGNESRADFIRERIAEGDELYLTGDLAQARDKWQSIVKLYRQIPEFELLVDQAKQRLLDPKEAIKRADEAEEPSSEIGNGE